jgi:hypothetical protein
VGVAFWVWSEECCALGDVCCAASICNMLQICNMLEKSPVMTPLWFPNPRLFKREVCVCAGCMFVERWMLDVGYVMWYWVLSVLCLCVLRAVCCVFGTVLGVGCWEFG